MPTETRLEPARKEISISCRQTEINDWWSRAYIAFPHDDTDATLMELRRDGQVVMRRGDTLGNRSD
ncbi:hypothetical protein B0H19DRAFT_1089222 [Mycena capillaripes]|nr:hypothetical protein B0H19DRAFT_1089222 [Mycena capillaripes]